MGSIGRQGHDPKAVPPWCMNKGNKENPIIAQNNALAENSHYKPRGTKLQLHTIIAGSLTMNLWW